MRVGDTTTDIYITHNGGQTWAKYYSDYMPQTFATFVNRTDVRHFSPSAGGWRGWLKPGVLRRDLINKADYLE